MTAKFLSRYQPARLIRLVIFILVIFGIIIILLFRKDKIDHPDFIQQNLSEADSLIKTMSLDEKINRLLVAKVNDDKEAGLFFQPLSPAPAAIIFSMDSSTKYLSILQQKRTLELPPLFFMPEKHHFHPEFYRIHKDHPNKNQILALTDTALFKEIIDTDISINRFLGVDAWLMKHPKPTAKRNKVYQAFQEAKIMTGTFFDPEVLHDSTFRLTPHILFINSDTLTNDKEGNKLFCSEIIRKNSGFKGLLIADFPEENISETIRNSSSDLFLAGSDYFSIKNTIKTLVENKELPEKFLDRRLRRILSVLLLKDQQRKEDTTYSKENAVPSSLNHELLFNSIRQKSMILLSNPNSILPFRTNPDKLKIFFHGELRNEFLSSVNHYTNAEAVEFSMDNISKNHRHDKKQLIIFNKPGQTQEKTENLLMHLDTIKTATNIIALLFDDQFYADFIPENITLIQIAGKTPADMKYAAQAIFGGQELSGQIPQEYRSSKYQYLQTPKTRLGYAAPERLGLDTSHLNRIDSIINDAIKKSCFPGCQVFFAYKGNVIWNKSYGYHTYARKRKVKNAHVYDLASITKVAATTLAAMNMVSKKKLDINKKISTYFEDTTIDYTRIKPDTIIRIDTLTPEELKKTGRKFTKQDTIKLSDSLIVLTDTIIYKNTPGNNIFKCRLRDMLIHKSGLPPSLPILRFLTYKNDTVLPLPAKFVINKDSILSFDTLKNRKDSLTYLFNKYYNTERIKDTSDCKIATRMYLRKAYIDTLWSDIKQTMVYSGEIYMYSDLNAVMAQMVLDSINDKPLNQYVYKNIYKPLGLKHTFFNPLNFRNKADIVPSENDLFWRNQKIHGYVHDPSAALLGGVAGNAGLFSNAEDLGHLFQMLLQEGRYGGRQYIRPGIVRHFTTRQKNAHRGLGFDLASSKNISAKDAPVSTFGHTGFTGTCVWADPQNEIIFVFLSNRTYPLSQNWKINKYKIRQKIHQTIYEALPKYDNNFHSLSKKAISLD
ncbi:MAG: serine hydrolase [Bacteroidales bacterium]